MNGLYKFVLTVSLVLVVEAKHKVPSEKSDECAVKFPNGFFCSSVCEKWHVLKGKTFVCFVSNDGEYHRFVGRNPSYGVWRFYKVNETSDLGSLCQTSDNGDKFFLNKTDTLCPTRDSHATTSPPHLDKSAHTTEESSTTEKEDHESSTESAKGEKRLSIKDIISKINDQVSKIFKRKPAEPEPEPEEVTEAPTSRSGYRSALARSESKKNQDNNKTLPMEGICQLVTTYIMDRKKLVNCDADDGKCCWASFNSKTVTSESLKKYDECYKGLNFIMDNML